MKVAELEGALLDYWAAQIEGMLRMDGGAIDQQLGGYSPSTKWAQGGPIIEREKIDLMHCEYRPTAMACKPSEPWNAMMQNLAIDNADWDSMSGSTPLIAAMRAFVGSKYGADVPDEVND